VCASGRIVFAGNVKIVCILNASINSRTSSLACFAPVPSSTTGFLLLLINLAAFLILRGLGATRAGGAVSTFWSVVSFTLRVNKLLARLKRLHLFSHKLYGLLHLQYQIYLYHLQILGVYTQLRHQPFY